MPDWAEAIILGIIEGITEFLPVSSTGHLLIAQRWVSQQTSMFNTVIQCGAVMAVVLVFREKIQNLIQSRKERASRKYIEKLAAAFILTGIGGLLLKKQGLELPENVAPVAWATLIGGALFIIIERRCANQKGEKPGAGEITWNIAIAVAAAQLVAAAFPGASRSGATIMIALVLGMSRAGATEFSFLLGIPTLLSAGAYEAFKAMRQNNPPTPHEWMLVAIGAIAASVTAFLVVRWLLRFIQTHSFIAFGWYRIILGATLLGIGDGSTTKTKHKSEQKEQGKQAAFRSYSQPENRSDSTTKRPVKSVHESARPTR